MAANYLNWYLLWFKLSAVPLIHPRSVVQVAIYTHFHAPKLFPDKVFCTKYPYLIRLTTWTAGPCSYKNSVHAKGNAYVAVPGTLQKLNG